MRFFVFLCCLSAFSLTPNSVLSQNAKVSITSVKTVTVDEVFDIIMNQTDYNFIYQEGLFSNFPKVTLKKGIITADNLLRISLSGGNFNYDFLSNNTIVIKKTPVINKVSTAQTTLVTGKVIDKTGMPLVGATVLIEGTKRGGVTNFDGEFKVNLNEGENVLVFSSLGYKTERIEVGSQTIINVTMQDDFSQLDEIVFIGYGKQKREEVTGAENNPPTFHLSRHYEVCKFLSLDEHTTIPDVLIMSTHLWDKLSPKEQVWMQKAVDASVKYQRELWAKAETDALEAVKKAGVTVVRPDKSAFQEKVNMMYDEYKGNKEIYELITKIKAVE